jgi:hypothetical protein
MSGLSIMAFSARITESAAATKTFGALRIDRRVLSTPARTIAIANVATVSVGTHVTPRPKLLYGLLALLFAVLALGSMRPDFSWGPPVPTGATVVIGFIVLLFAGLALRPDDKTHYLLISSNDGVLSRFTAPDRAILDEVRSILTDKINRADEAMTFNVNFERGQIENLAAPGAGSPPAQQLNGTGNAAAFANGTATGDRAISQPQGPRPRPGLAGDAVHGGARQPRPQPMLASASNGAAKPSPDTFVDYSTVLPAVVEMHRFYARQPGTQHLEQRLSELELLMRAGTPTPSQKTRLRELAGDMSQILGAYPQAVELFDHIGGLV